MQMSGNSPWTNDVLKSIDCSRNFANGRELTRLIELLSGMPAGLSPDPLRQYCPTRPWPKQQAFLALECREALFGGAAGGGKSESLLMAALQFVHVPGYAALILRKDTQRLRLAGGLIPRSHEWLTGTAAKWNEERLTWLFPTGGTPASLTFGYLSDSLDRYRYGSSEYQFIAFDELTEMAEEDYRFLFSRLRKRLGMPVPLRMRAATNPGGPGHAWVRGRFVPEDGGRRAEVGDRKSEGGGQKLEVGDRSRGVLAAGTLPEAKDGSQESRKEESESSQVLYKHEIAFVPATIADNPALDEATYRESLAHLPTVLRERLMHGDWSALDQGLISSAWLREYSQQDNELQLFDGAHRAVATIDATRCRRFATVDPAGTSEDRAKEQRGRAPSWTVIQVWDQPRDKTLAKFLLLRHVVRVRVGFDGLCAALREVQKDWQPGNILIENEKLGRAAHDLLRRELPLRCISTGGRDKVSRAAPLIAKLERGEIFLPRHNTSWRADLEAEWIAWTGLEEATTDQIDAAAYAVLWADHRPPRTVKILPPGW